MSKNRKSFLLDYIDKSLSGIEIGPSHSPIASKKAGYKVKIIDYLSQADLKQKYASHGVNLKNIEKVDYVWSGESYKSLVKNEKFEWIIASHVIEHTPDLIGFLQDCESIMTKDALLCLAIPDYRFCFDKFRPLSSLSKIIDYHLNQNTKHTPGNIAEYYLNAVSLNQELSWTFSDEKSDFRFIHTADESKNKMIEAMRKDKYFDIHSWCFTPNSFRLLISDLNFLKFINIKEVFLSGSNGHEFYVILSAKGHSYNSERLNILQEISKEIKL